MRCFVKYRHEEISFSWLLKPHSSTSINSATKKLHENDSSSATSRCAQMRQSRAAIDIFYISDPWNTAFGVNSPVQQPHQVVWKMFCIILLGADSAASSRAASSDADRRQPSEPMLSFACCIVFAPGIGMAPWQMHQLIATCDMDTNQLWALLDCYYAIPYTGLDRKSYKRYRHIRLVPGYCTYLDVHMEMVRLNNHRKGMSTDS